MKEDLEKVYFKGESMWVKVESRADDGKHLMGTVYNYPLNFAVHQYRFGDDVVAHLVDHGEFKSWEPIHTVNPDPAPNPDNESDVSIQEVFESADEIK